MYLNTVVNGLQGTGLFLIYCVLNSEVRSVVRRISERNRITFVPNGNKPLRRISRLRRGEASFRTTSEEGSNVIRANYSPGIFSQLPKWLAEKNAQTKHHSMLSGPVVKRLARLNVVKLHDFDILQFALWQKYVERKLCLQFLLSL